MQAETAEEIETVEFESGSDFGESDSSSAVTIDLQAPPFSEVHSGPDYDKTSVTIELTNNTRVKGKLLTFSAANEEITILEPRAVVPTEVDMGTLKYMHLEKPYQLMLSSTGNPGISVDSEARSFEVYFKDRTELTGKTFGTRTDKNGIHLYEQTKVGRKWRYCTHLFVTKAAIENHIIGGQIGEMLVEENIVTQEVVDTALQDQQEERSRLLGEYLVTQKIVDARELESALALPEG